MAEGGEQGNPAPGRGVSFDGMARAYRWLEYAALGTMLEKMRTRHLRRLGGCRRALVLGDGDGRFTAALMEANPQVQVDAVDLSPAMLRLLRRRVEARGAGERLRTHCADARSDQLRDTPTGRFDLIATHFFLDCLEQAEADALVARLAARLVPGGLWVVSEFRIPQGVMRLPARAYIRALYLAFRVLTGLRVTRLPEFARTLEGCGMTCLAAEESTLGMLTAQLWQRREERGGEGGDDVEVTKPRAGCGDGVRGLRIRTMSETSVTPAAGPKGERPAEFDPHPHAVEDAQPDPEPAVPSLPEPDPGVFHHGPAGG